MSDSLRFDLCYEILVENIKSHNPEHSVEEIKRYFNNQEPPVRENNFSDVLSHFLNSCITAENDDFVQEVMYYESHDVISIKQMPKRDPQAPNFLTQNSLIFNRRTHPKIFYVEFDKNAWRDWDKLNKINLNFSGDIINYELKSIIFHNENQIYCGAIFFDQRVVIKLKDKVPESYVVDLEAQGVLETGFIFIESNFIKSRSSSQSHQQLLSIFQKKQEANIIPNQEEKPIIEVYRDSIFPKNIPFIFATYRNVHNNLGKAKTCSRCGNQCPKNARKCFYTACRARLEEIKVE